MPETNNKIPNFITSLKDRGFPKFEKELENIPIISSETFITNHNLAYFNDTSEARAILNGEDVSAISLGDLTELYTTVVLPRVAHLVISGGVANINMRLSNVLTDFMFDNTILSSVTVGAREVVDVDSVLADLVKSKIIRVELVHKAITAAKNNYAILIYENINPILSIPELDDIRTTARQLSDTNDNKGLMDLFDDEFNTAFMHDVLLLQDNEIGGLLTFNMLAKPEKPSKEQSLEVKHNLLLYNMSSEYVDLIKPTVKGAMLIHFFNHSKGNK